MVKTNKILGRSAKIKAAAGFLVFALLVMSLGIFAYIKDSERNSGNGAYAADPLSRTVSTAGGDTIEYAWASDSSFANPASAINGAFIGASSNGLSTASASQYYRESQTVTLSISSLADMNTKDLTLPAPIDGYKYVAGMETWSTPSYSARHAPGVAASFAGQTVLGDGYYGTAANFSANFSHDLVINFEGEMKGLVNAGRLRMTIGAQVVDYNMTDVRTIANPGLSGQAKYTPTNEGHGDGTFNYLLYDESKMVQAPGTNYYSPVNTDNKSVAGSAPDINDAIQLKTGGTAGSLLNVGVVANGVLSYDGSANAVVKLSLVVNDYRSNNISGDSSAAIVGNVDERVQTGPLDNNFNIITHPDFHYITPKFTVYGYKPYAKIDADTFSLRLYFDKPTDEKI
ncbi:MAG: hypothetical protein LBN25_02505, partial [Christensenellaceae bacterium]|nr:hypothetical protein [Christensenellaceae bacterium]